MHTFEELITAQQQTAEQIEAIFRNYKKDPAARKTARYYEERLRRTEEVWSEFESNDNKIRCLSNLPVHSEYFTHQYLYISDLVLKIKDIFETKVKKLTEEIHNPQKPTAFPLHGEDENATGINRDTINQTSSKSSAQQLDETTAKVLRNQRALMRALKRNIDEIQIQVNENNTESYYLTKAALIDKYMKDFAINNNVLWNSTNGDDIDGYTLDDYYKVEAEAHDIMSKLQQYIRVENANVPQRNSRSENFQIKLPNIEIPKFNGSYLQWVAFKDLYTQLVHNTEISEVQKMLYLTTHLADEPRGLIKHLPITTANYSIAWNILVNRYDNKRLIVTTLLNNLLSYPKMKNETAQTLKSLHDLTKECVHGLKAQGLPVNEWDVILVHLLLRKLDQTTQTIFEQSLNDNKRLINLNELLRFIEHRFQALKTHGKPHNAAGGKDRTKTSATTSTSGSCKVCGSTGHPIYYCEKFLRLRPNERLQWTQKQKLCVNCFKSDHAAKACTSRSCTKCSNKHNTLLHLETSTKGSSPASKTTISEKNQTQASETKPNGSDTSSNAPIVAAANKQRHKDNYVLLATARVKIIGKNGRIGEFRALLDSGSQINLVTERVISKLSLQPSESSLSIEGVGRKTRKVAQRVNFELRSHSGSYSTRVEAFVLPNIVSPQPTQTLDTSNWSHPQTLALQIQGFTNPTKSTYSSEPNSITN